MNKRSQFDIGQPNNEREAEAPKLRPVRWHHGRNVDDRQVQPFGLKKRDKLKRTVFNETNRRNVERSMTVMKHVVKVFQPSTDDLREAKVLKEQLFCQNLKGCKLSASNTLAVPVHC